MTDDKNRIIEEISLIRNIIKYIVVDGLPYNQSIDWCMANPEKMRGDQASEGSEHATSLLTDSVSEHFDDSARKNLDEKSKLEERILNEKRLDKKKSDNLEFLEGVLFELKNNKGKDNFSMDIKKEKKEINEALSFVIKYRENEREERLKVEAEDENKKKYSFEIIKEKAVPDNQPYELNVIYENNKTEEKLGVKYSLRDYPSEREHALQDFTNRVDKTLHIFPKSIMGGVLGFTYLGENFMGRRDDLTGSKALMVDVHEAIHTPDEYETRVLTDWILSRERVRYKR